MKVKNTVFFGAMAAILMSAGAANAEITQIASTEYVDSVVSKKADASVVETVSGLTTTVETLGAAVGTLDTTVGTLNTTVSGLSDDVETVADSVNGINTKIGDGTMTVGGTAVETIVGAINALDAKTTDLTGYATETWVGEQGYATQTELAAKANTADLKALAYKDTVDTAEIADNAVTEDKIANGNVTEAKLSAEVQNKINSALTDSNLENVLTTKSLEGYQGKTKTAIPQPSDVCKGASGTCVLTVDTEGNLMWMNVTKPAEAE